LGLVNRRSSKNVTRRAGKRRGPGLNRFSETASLSPYSLTSSLQLARIGPLQRSSAACTTLPKLMAPRNHSTAEPGVGLCDLLVTWTQARRLGNIRSMRFFPASDSLQRTVDCETGCFNYQETIILDFRAFGLFH